MRFTSTVGNAPAADLKTALFQGLAPDGGLYLPAELPRMAPAALERLRGNDWPQTALAVLRHLLRDELEPAALDRIVREALNFPMPLVPVGRGPLALELFHGPTLAFKDVGARFMARLMATFHDETDRRLTVLVATSGDTGSAVAHAFFGLPNTRVVVLFPEGRVSPIQERQFTTLGGNVAAIAVSGTFDDCQRLAKRALADDEMRREISLTSANSINIGRLLPQLCYYVHAWAALPEPPRNLVISVPSGNFGNLTAGLMARRLGLPVTRFVAATNTNDVVPRFLQTGRFEPRPSVETISSAMDVGNPSNFARILALYGGEVDRLRADVIAAGFSDADTRRAIADTFRQTGYILDPHSAVGLLGLREGVTRHPGAAGIFLATAHPAKFADVVEPLIGKPIPVPERLARGLAGTPRVTRIAPDFGAFRPLLAA